MSTKNNAAARIHAIADELGCAPELVAAIRAEDGIRRFDALKAAVEARLSSASATVEADEPVVEADDAGSQPKPKKAGLTLSQRRALLRLLDEGFVAPVSAFKALPFEHLERVGYAASVPTDDGPAVFTLTDEGTERATSINPGYRVWSSGETVAGDPNRPVAGTHRTKRIEEEVEAPAEA